MLVPEREGALLNHCFCEDVYMTGTAYFKTPKSDPLLHQAASSGYRIGWKFKKKFERSHLDGEMTYAAALAKAEEMNAAEPEKVFWPELLFETPDGITA